MAVEHITNWRHFAARAPAKVLGELLPDNTLAINPCYLLLIELVKIRHRRPRWPGLVRLAYEVKQLIMKNGQCHQGDFKGWLQHQQLCLS